MRPRRRVARPLVTRRIAAVPAGAVLLLALGGCESASPAGMLVLDSAGVRFTLNADEARVFAEVEPEPTLSLGGSEAAGPTQFFQIHNVHVDAAGRVWVADGGSAEVRIFLPDATHFKTRGGRGEGPGEFLQLRLLGAVAGDTVLAADVASGRVTVLGPDGELVRTVRMGSAEGAAPRLARSFPDGTVLGQVPRTVMASSLEPGQVLRDSVELVRTDLEGRILEPGAAAPGPLWVWTGRSQVPVPFTAPAAFDVLGEAVHLAAGPNFRVRVFEAGVLSEVYGVDRPPRPVTDEDVRAHRQLTEEYVPAEQLADYLSVLDHEARPELLPAYARLVVAANGNVWAQIHASDLLAELTWDVFGADRGLLGQVRTPAGLHVTRVGPDAVTGVWRDALGVEHVRTYRLVGR